MADMGSYNINQRDIDNYGGEPFYQFNGAVCHRGNSTRKIATMHPMSTIKKCIYKSDGSGRDGYITVNNGGLSIHNVSVVNGSD